MNTNEVKWAELVDYNQATGILTWKPRPVSAFTSPSKWRGWTTQFCGQEAGHRATARGRRSAVDVRYGSKLYKAHRIIWILLRGHIPVGYLPDHKDGNPWNNRPGNLRLATTGQNIYNSKRSTRNRSGIKGIAWHRGAKKWVARIRFDGKEKYLGLYPTKGLAAVAHAKAAIRYHGEFARLS